MSLRVGLVGGSQDVVTSVCNLGEGARGLYLWWQCCPCVNILNKAVSGLPLAE